MPLIDKIVSKQYREAKSLIEEKISDILQIRLVEAKKAFAARNINELSSDLLHRYSQKAGDDIRKVSDPKKTKNRKAGIQTVMLDKTRKAAIRSMTKEENIDESSINRRLAMYRKKIISDRNKESKKFEKNWLTSNYGHKKTSKILNKIRDSKKDVREENIQEISNKKLRDYVKKSEDDRGFSTRERINNLSRDPKRYGKRTTGIHRADNRIYARALDKKFEAPGNTTPKAYYKKDKKKINEAKGMFGKIILQALKNRANKQKSKSKERELQMRASLKKTPKVDKPLEKARYPEHDKLIKRGFIYKSDDVGDTYTHPKHKK